MADLTHVWSRNWGHFLLEVCGRLAGQAGHLDGLRPLVNRDALTGNFGAAFRTFGVDIAERAIPCADWGSVGCRRVLHPRGCWTPSHCHEDPGRRTQDAVRFHDPDAARALYRMARPGRRPESLRIVLARPEGGRPRCLNEAAMVDAFVARGFHAVRPEKLAFRDQAALFYDADAVAGAYGAGMVNLVFCRPGTRVTCVDAAGTNGSVYPAIASTSGLDLSMLHAPVVDVGPVRDCATLNVDIDAMLDAALG